MPIQPAFLVATLAFFAPVSDTRRPALPVGTQSYTIEDAARTPYALYIPPDFDSNWPAPLVLVLSQGKNSEKDLLQKSGWTKQAERVGFATVGFNVAESTSTATLTALFARLETQISVDPARVFVICDPGPVPLLEPLAERLAAVSVATADKAPTLSGVAIDLRKEGAGTQETWNFFDQHPRLTGKPSTTRLVLRCTGLRNEKGRIMVALFRGESGFPNDNKKAYRSFTAAISGNTATVTIPDLPPGDYACAFVHDENANDELDTSLGYPLEGFGVSNNPRVRSGPPRFEEARFFLAGDTAEKRIFLRATYL